jgi:hypothetical protein
VAVARHLLGKMAQPLTSEPRPDTEPNHHLLQTPLRFVPMTEVQAARCNAALAPGSSNAPEQALSPRQRELLRRAETSGRKDWPLAIDVPIERPATGIRGSEDQRISPPPGVVARSGRPVPLRTWHQTT